MRSITSLAILLVALGCERGPGPPGHHQDAEQQLSEAEPTHTDAEADWRPCARAPKPSDWDVVLWVTTEGRSKSLALAEAYIAKANPWSSSETELKPIIAWSALYSVARARDRHEPLLNLVTSQWFTDVSPTPESVLRDIRKLAPDRELQTLFAAPDGRQRLVSVTRSGRSEWSARVEDVLDARLALSFGNLGITDLPGPVVLPPSPYGADFRLDAEEEPLDVCRTLVLLSPGQDEERRKSLYEQEQLWAQNTALQRRLRQIEEHEAQAGE